MGVFTQTSYAGQSLADTLDSIMESTVVPCDTEDMLEAALDIVIDNERNYNSIMEQVAQQELAALESTGAEIVYTESSISDMAQAVKRFLLKIWDKLKAIFKRFMMLFDSYAKTDKEFVNKYKSTIFKSKDLSDFTFKGYDYTIEKAHPMIRACQSKVDDMPGSEEEAKRIRENFSDGAEKFRGEVLKAGGHSGSACDQSEFMKELHAALRKGMDEKEELEHIDPNTLANELMGSKDAKKQLNDLFKESKKAIDVDIKETERMQKEGLKEMPNKDKAKAAEASANMTMISVYLQILKGKKDIMVSVNGAALAALKERSRQYKACLVKIAGYKGKSESSLEESSVWQHSDKSFLSDIQLR